MARLRPCRGGGPMPRALWLRATVVAGVGHDPALACNRFVAQLKWAQSLCHQRWKVVQVLGRAADLSGVSMGNVEQATVQPDTAS